MKLLFLSKRRPQQRDLVVRPYGRFHHLPLHLAGRGHQVTVVLIGHHGLPPITLNDGGVTTIALDLRSQGMYRVNRALAGIGEAVSPDWVVGCSDAWLGWLASRLARRCSARLAIDAYDNYEAYMPWNLPLHIAWRKSVRNADIVTVAGPQLGDLLGRERTDKSSPVVIPMAADPGFVSMDKEQCRQDLGLPATLPLLGYIGGWGAARGTDLLVTAFREVLEQVPTAKLVLSGSAPKHVVDLPGVLPMGYVDDSVLPRMLNCLDVACIVTADTRFGRYSYPAKLCEAMACGIAVCATATEPVRWMLCGSKAGLAPVGNAVAFAGTAVRALGVGKVEYGILPSWEESARLMESALQAAS